MSMLFLLLATPVATMPGEVLPGNMTDAALETRVRDFYCRPHPNHREKLSLGFHNGMEVIIDVKSSPGGKEPPFAIVRYRNKSGTECTAMGGTEFYAGFPQNGTYGGVPAKKHCGATVLVQKNLASKYLILPGMPLPPDCKR